MTMTRLFLIASFLFASVARAGEPDIASLYDLSTAGTSTAVKAGEKGKVVISIAAKGGAHVSGDAPLKIELSSKELKPEKEKLTLADSIGPKETDPHKLAPKFEVAFAAPKAGKASLEAKLTFFICTETACNRQQKTLQLPVEVN